MNFKKELTSLIQYSITYSQVTYYTKLYKGKLKVSIGTKYLSLKHFSEIHYVLASFNF